MKRRKRLAALWAALLLLTGCAPGPATEAETPPPATSAPVGTQTLAGVDFSAFLEEANAARRAVLEDGPTLGCSLTPNNCNFYLPNTGLRVYFGTGLSFCESLENIDGAGFLPDLWVEPADALDAAVRLCQYYNLK